MSCKLPHVRDVWLLFPEADGCDLRLDTPAWFAWLEMPETRSFAYGLVDPAQGYIVGLMTVRKEGRQRGDWYWSVYRRQGSQLRRFYLGRSHKVTQRRLHQIAQQLLKEAAKNRGNSK